MKYRLKSQDVDLAAVNKHHVPGTAYHWKHGYIPLDARTAALWGKKDHEHRLIREGKITTHEPEHRGHETDAKPSRATHSLNVIDKPHEQSPVVPTVKHEPKPPVERKRVAAKKVVAAAKPEEPNTQKDTTRKVLHPEKGDQVDVHNGTMHRRYEFNGSKWTAHFKNPDGSFRKASIRSADRDPVEMKSYLIAGRLGVQPEDVAAYANSDEFKNRLNSETLAAAQKAFGKEKVHGFSAAPAGDIVGGLGVLHMPGTYYLKHDNGTTIHVNDGLAFSKADLHRFAGHVNTTTAKTEHLVGEHNGGRVAYHLDRKYAQGKNWSRRVRGGTQTTNAYVLGGDKSSVHVNPAIVKGAHSTEPARGGAGFYLGDGGGVSGTEHTLTHELGHIHHNREGNFTYQGDLGFSHAHDPGNPEHVKERDLLDFHSSQYRELGGLYGKTNNREGYAEAFAHHVISENTSAALKAAKARVQDEATKARLEKHDAVAKAYRDKFGWQKSRAGIKEKSA